MSPVRLLPHHEHAFVVIHVSTGAGLSISFWDFSFAFTAWLAQGPSFLPLIFPSALPPVNLIIPNFFFQGLTL